MSGIGFWGGPEGVKIPTPHIKGQQDAPYFHGGPGWSHEGPVWRCHLEHPGDPGWVDPEIFEEMLRDGDEGPYEPRHRKPETLEELEGAIALQVAGILRQAPKVAPRSVLLWVGVDLDGTIAEPLWTPENPTSEIGAPIWRNASKLRELISAGYKVVIHTSRPWTDYEAIETWLNYHGIRWHQIQCGKPLFALYVDDRGRHESAESWLP